MGPHEELGLQDPSGFRGISAGAGYGYGRMLDYKVIVCVCVEVTEPFL